MMVLGGGTLAQASTAAFGNTDRACLASFQKPETGLARKSVETTINNKKSSSEIKTFARSVDGFKPSAKGRQLGLAHSRFAYNLRIQLASKRIEGRRCFGVRKVGVELALVRSEIFIDKKYRPGSCAYKAILAHEREHVAINERVWDQYSKHIEAEVARLAADIKPFYGSRSDKASKMVSERLSRELKPLLDQVNETRAEENSRIDSEKSYREVRARCVHW
ncbi:hypothetical protein [Sneathiella chinensis]|uniref:DUF922 domain-containing protein n=2 Tax=Sneathiella chinensis TaxID=349750 RepID=A0ABQ5U4K1_9PROT|nr:hypothetical protein [Sneathiella chinensis]GLQ05411.1 hypothetical protein GCM10007924_06320 [Sneathiella chinensis]